MNNREAGERLVAEARRISERDLESAWKARDFNLTVRRAQETVELALNGALKMLGVAYPKVHDVGETFARQVRVKSGGLSEETLSRIQDISAWLSEARAPAFYHERLFGEADARQAREDAAFVLGAVTRLLEEASTAGSE